MTNEFDQFDDGSGLSGRRSGRRTRVRVEDSDIVGGKPRNSRRRLFRRTDEWTQLGPLSQLPPARATPVGWSVAIAALSITAVSLLAISVGSHVIGVIACVGMVFSAWGLVLAELVTRYGRRDSDLED